MEQRKALMLVVMICALPSPLWCCTDEGANLSCEQASVVCPIALQHGLLQDERQAYSYVRAVLEDLDEMAMEPSSGSCWELAVQQVVCGGGGGRAACVGSVTEMERLARERAVAGGEAVEMVDEVAKQQSGVRKVMTCEELTMLGVWRCTWGQESRLVTKCVRSNGKMCEWVEGKKKGKVVLWIAKPNAKTSENDAWLLNQKRSLVSGQIHSNLTNMDPSKATSLTHTKSTLVGHSSSSFQKDQNGGVTYNKSSHNKMLRRRSNSSAQYSGGNNADGGQ